MKYIAIIDDNFLANFRLDDDGLTLVVADKLGLDRALRLKPLIHPTATFETGENLQLTQGHLDAMLTYERNKMLEEFCAKINEDYGFNKSVLTVDEIKRQFELPIDFKNNTDKEGDAE